MCRKMGILQATFFRWKQLYAALMPSVAQKLRQLEEENVRRRKAVADLTLDKEVLQEVIRRNLCRLLGDVK
jgi:putative transposase